METAELDMDDLFGGGEEAEELQMPADLPQLDDDDNRPMTAADDMNSQNDDDAALANIKNLSKGAAKRRVLHPQPKLDSDRLRSSRGLPALNTLFEDVKFKGKGHEASDLKLMMGKLEHWAHRLFPKLQFDDFIERLERLGGKREVQTCIKRIRMDMPMLDSDLVPAAADEDADQRDEADEVDAAAVFGEMLSEEHDLQTHHDKAKDDEDEFDFFDGAPSPDRGSSPTSHAQQVVGTPSQRDAQLSNAPNLHCDLDNVNDRNASSDSQPDKTSLPQNTPLSCEQKKKIEANKLAALKKRAARMGVTVDLLLSQQDTTSSEQATTDCLENSCSTPDKTQPSTEDTAHLSPQSQS